MALIKWDIFKLFFTKLTCTFWFDDCLFQYGWTFLLWLRYTHSWRLCVQRAPKIDWCTFASLITQVTVSMWTTIRIELRYFKNKINVSFCKFDFNIYYTLDWYESSRHLSFCKSISTFIDQMPVRLESGEFLDKNCLDHD